MRVQLPQLQNLLLTFIHFLGCIFGLMLLPLYLLLPLLSPLCLCDNTPSETLRWETSKASPATTASWQP